MINYVIDMAHKHLYLTIMKKISIMLWSSGLFKDNNLDSGSINGPNAVANFEKMKISNIILMTRPKLCKIHFSLYGKKMRIIDDNNVANFDTIKYVNFSKYFKSGNNGKVITYLVVMDIKDRYCYISAAKIIILRSFTSECKRCRFNSRVWYL